ncbi:hypothetical protein [Microbacterium sp. NPDC077057]
MPNVLIRDLDPGVHSVLTARAQEQEVTTLTPESIVAAVHEGCAGR